MMFLLHRYVLRRFSYCYVSSASGLIGIFLVADFFERIDEFFRRDMPYSDLVFYFIYKIISTIKIVSELNNRSKKQKFVPIFWLASEDHDFDEISQVNISGKSLKWEKETLNQPVGKINSDKIENVIKKYKNEIIDSKYSNKLIKLIDDHYTSFTSLSKATRSFINSLFSEYGIIVIDADSKNFKETFQFQTRTTSETFM